MFVLQVLHPLDLNIFNPYEDRPSQSQPIVIVIAKTKTKTKKKRKKKRGRMTCQPLRLGPRTP